MIDLYQTLGIMERDRTLSLYFLDITIAFITLLCVAPMTYSLSATKLVTYKQCSYQQPCGVVCDWPKPLPEDERKLKQMQWALAV